MNVWIGRILKKKHVANNGEYVIVCDLCDCTLANIFRFISISEPVFICVLLLFVTKNDIFLLFLAHSSQVFVVWNIMYGY